MTEKCADQIEQPRYSVHQFTAQVNNKSVAKVYYE